MTTLAKELVSLEKARQEGLRRYYTGRPCKRGHITDRWTNGRACCQCASEGAKANTLVKRELRKDPEYRALEAARRKIHKAREHAYNKTRRSDPKTWPIVNLPLIRKRAKDAGMEFSITVEDIQVPETCPVFGTPIVCGSWNGSPGNSPHIPSVDRIDNSRGYSKDNVCVISMRANMLKKDATLEELEALVRYMKGGVS